MDDRESCNSVAGTFGDYFIKRFQENVSKEFGNDNEIHKLGKSLETWFEKFFFCGHSESWFKISPSGANVFESCEGDQQLNWKNQGYRTILDVLMKKIPNDTEQLDLDEKILLNKEVREIILDDIASNDRVTVSCSDGSIYNADHVIMTTSVGVLKRFHESMFKPKLPAYKINSISNVGFGTVNKILLKFPTTWWPSDLKGINLLWTEKDKAKLINELSNFEPTENGRSWLEDIFGFYVIDSHPRVLLTFVVGDMAPKVEKVSDEMVTQGCMYLLRTFSGGIYEIPEPDEILRSKWSSNCHSCGSYAHVSIEAQKRKASAEDLAKPLLIENGKPVVLFAGEATHSTKFSTVNGAVETGYREAERLINMYNKPECYKIVIMGAGMAGLGAALKLSELGISDFLILEAQEQIGGRIKTIEVDGRPVDIGAQWLHGKDNLLYNFALKHDLLSQEVSEEGLGKFIRNDSVIFDEFLVKSVAFQIGKILEECQTFIDKTDYPTSVGDFLDQKFLEYLDSCDDTDELRQMKLELFDWHLRFQIIDNSCYSMKRLSAKYWGSYVCVDDIAHYNLKYGYHSLVKIMTNNLPKERIRLKSAVTEILWSDPNNKIKIVCNDNQFISCDHLIITASIGVLKEFTKIDPPIPPKLKTTIDNIGFYGIGKVFLFFDYKWWEDDFKGFQLIWKSDTVFEEDERWIRHMTGFDPVFNQPNALVGWVGSDGVQPMENLPENVVGRICTRVLRKFLPGYQIPHPVTVARTRWFSNPWVKGSYCHITPECEDPHSGIDKLSEPVYVDGVPRILLAGEAVHSSHYSTTHGAFESGQQQATVLCDYILKG